jgi:microcystin-dependent protein
MSTPFVGEIRMFGGNFAPAGWMLCQGQTMAISENDALFNLIGTTYGGDGQNTFALPNLQSRIPIHQGTGPFGDSYVIGQSGGVEQVTLTSNQIPQHTHQVAASAKGGNQRSPVNAVPAVEGAGVTSLYSDQPPNAASKWPEPVPAGGSQPHDNMQPYLCVNFIISLFGIYPSQ